MSVSHRKTEKTDFFWFFKTWNRQTAVKMVGNRQTQKFFEKCKCLELFSYHIEGIRKKIIFKNFRASRTQGGAVPPQFGSKKVPFLQKTPLKLDVETLSLLETAYVSLRFAAKLSRYGLSINFMKIYYIHPTILDPPFCNFCCTQ